MEDTCTIVQADFKLLQFQLLQLKII